MPIERSICFMLYGAMGYASVRFTVFLFVQPMFFFWIERSTNISNVALEAHVHSRGFFDMQNGFDDVFSTFFFFTCYEREKKNILAIIHNFFSFYFLLFFLFFLSIFVFFVELF